MTGALLIYGANGYTGELTARFAAERKQPAIVAGRSAERVRAVADRYGYRANNEAGYPFDEVCFELSDVGLGRRPPDSIRSRPLV